MVEVADVGSRVRSQKTYDLAFIIQNSKIADAGGPFGKFGAIKQTVITIKSRKGRIKFITK